MQALIGLALGLVQEAFAAYDVVPFGLKPDDFAAFAMAQFEQRLTRVEKARRQTVEEVVRGEGFEEQAD
jgi:ribonucleoside-diphosphate reductase beta chain